MSAFLHRAIGLLAGLALRILGGEPVVPTNFEAYRNPTVVARPALRVIRGGRS